MDITQEHKNEIEKEIVEVIISALEDKKILESQLSEVAGFVLERIDSIKTKDELIAFLSELSSRWPIFENIALTEKADVKEQAEDKIADKTLKLVQDGKIDEAIDMAKTMTNA